MSNWAVSQSVQRDADRLTIMRGGVEVWDLRWQPDGSLDVSGDYDPGRVTLAPSIVEELVSFLNREEF